MIVVDASASIEWALRTPTGIEIGELFEAELDRVVPEVWLVECLNVMRRAVLTGKVDGGDAAQRVQLLRDFAAERVGHDALAGRIWQLRHNLTATDAAYVALAERHDARLVTTDGAMSRASGHHAAMTVFAV